MLRNEGEHKPPEGTFSGDCANTPTKRQKQQKKKIVESFRNIRERRRSVLWVVFERIVNSKYNRNENENELFIHRMETSSKYNLFLSFML
jgi:hypothetical protein